MEVSDRLTKNPTLKKNGRGGGALWEEGWLVNKCFKCTSTRQGEHMCLIILKSINVEVVAQTS